jgi:predicted unusual protein kinase regulating ubiquinone biosynthesis (AarF/ABC1/UbiB family)
VSARPRERRALASAKLARAAALAGCGLGQLAARAVDSERVQRNARRHVARTLGRLRGLPQKLGQILGTCAGQENAADFAYLTDGAEPLPLAELVPTLEQAWGQRPGRVVRSIEPAGLAASLGQVHRAELRDGRTVAIKIQYPEIAAAVAHDLEMLGWLSAPLGGLARGFDLAGYRTTIGAMLARELDYRAEAREQREYAELARGTGVCVPAPVEELCSARVLVSLWEPGEPVAAARLWRERERALCAQTLLAHFLAHVFGHGRVHADLHPGNVRFRRAAAEGVVLYDFGCIEHLSQRERLALRELVRAAEDGCADPFPLFVELGFDATLLAPMRARLPALCRVLFEPFLSRAPCALENWRLGERVAELLGEQRWNFRISGPPRLVYLMRAMHGLLHHLSALGAALAWHPLLEPFLAPALEPHTPRSEVLPGSGPETGTSGTGQARFLCIRVTRDGEVRARVSMPSSAIERLDELLEEGVRARIEQRGISLAALVRRARERQLAPQPVFQLREGTQTVEVWLE